MQGNILVWVIFFLMVIILAVQFQVSDLNRKLQETIKKVDELLIKKADELLKEQVKEKRSDIKLPNTPL
jgi:predicted Holliday junction resolvase-like endonuclease